MGEGPVAAIVCREVFANEKDAQLTLCKRLR